MQRRTLLKTVGAAAVVGAAASGTATADSHENDSREYRELTIRIRTDEGTDPTHDYHEGAIEGLDDFGVWLETWMPYVDSVEVLDQTGFADFDPIGDIDDVADQYPDYTDTPDSLNVCLTSSTDLSAGYADGKLYNADSDGTNAHCYVNSNHIPVIDLGSDAGYNFAVHEAIHCMTYHTTSDTGAKLDHGFGETWNPLFDRLQASIMVTGYANEWQDYEPQIPDTECDGSSLSQGRRPEYNPVITECTANELVAFHFGDKYDAASPATGRLDISENEGW
ncbi:hypothetical protein [Halovivax limisalsi]|uniref:hypothetical protein n=1 Tax=Halovivax limisalsi TaxID=1453760 RepID=UPI001FFC7B0F|nr:hypothetical protein [Halovivax limisalsi]